MDTGIDQKEKREREKKIMVTDNSVVIGAIVGEWGAGSKGGVNAVGRRLDLGWCTDDVL